MTLTPQTIDAYKQILSNPSKHGFNFKPLNECFSKSETVTAQHILFDSYVGYIAKPLPKVVFYIIMQEIHGQPFEKDEKGCLGYRLTFQNPSLLP